MNLLIAVVCGFLVKTFFMETLLLNVILVSIATMNVGLGIFNLVPIHPLDGSKILSGLLPDEMAHEYAIVMNQFGTLLLIFLIIPMNGISPLNALIGPVINMVMKWVL
jgi:Zn-dependent protease